MIDASKKLAFYITGSAVLAITASTMVMNAKYGYSQGHDDLEKGLFVVAGISMDLVKVFGLVFVVQAWSKRNWFKATIGTAIWAICVLYGFIAASGFALSSRTYNTAEQTFSNSKIEKAQETYNILLSDLNTLKKEQDTMKTNQRYLSTAGCTVPEVRMTVESRYFCTQYFTHLNKISDKTSEVKLAKDKVPQDTYIKPVDPQMVFWADAFQIPMKKLLQHWSIGIAISFELISALGMYAISPTRRQPIRREDESPDIEAAPVKRGPGRPKGSKNKPKLAVVDGKNVNTTEAA